MVGEVAQKIQFEAAALDPGERSADCRPKPGSESHVGNRRLVAILVCEQHEREKRERTTAENRQYQ